MGARAWLAIPVLVLALLFVGCGDRQPLEPSVSGVEGPPVAFVDNPNRPGELMLVQERYVFADGRFDLFAIALGSGQEYRLTDRPGDDGSPEVSPDGSKIAFHRRDDAGDYDIWVRSWDGTSLLNVTRNSGGWDLRPAWSPDGKTLAFQSTRAGNVDIYTVRPDGSGLQRVTTNPAAEIAPQWAPDGKRLLFASSRDGDHDLYVLDLNHKTTTKLTDFPGLDYPGGYSTDGDFIVFTARPDGVPDIYIMEVGGGGNRGSITQLTDNGIWENDPSFSPDGSQIAFSRTDGTDFELFVMNRDGTGETQITFNSDVDNRPRWTIGPPPALSPVLWDADNLTATISPTGSESGDVENLQEALTLCGSTGKTCTIQFTAGNFHLGPEFHMPDFITLLRGAGESATWLHAGHMRLHDKLDIEAIDLTTVVFLWSERERIATIAPTAEESLDRSNLSQALVLCAATKDACTVNLRDGTLKLGEEYILDGFHGTLIGNTQWNRTGIPCETCLETTLEVANLIFSGGTPEVTNLALQPPPQLGGVVEIQPSSCNQALAAAVTGVRAESHRLLVRGCNPMSTPASVVLSNAKWFSVRFSSMQDGSLEVSDLEARSVSLESMGSVAATLKGITGDNLVTSAAENVDISASNVRQLTLIHTQATRVENNTLSILDLDDSSNNQITGNTFVGYADLVAPVESFPNFPFIVLFKDSDKNDIDLIGPGAVTVYFHRRGDGPPFDDLMAEDNTVAGDALVYFATRDGADHFSIAEVNEFKKKLELVECGPGFPDCAEAIEYGVSLYP